MIIVLPLNFISSLFSGYLGYKAHSEGHEPYRRVATAWFLSAALGSIIEGIMLASQNKSVVEITGLSLLLIFFLNCSILLHYVTLLIYGFVNLLWTIPMYVPPIFLAVLMFTLDLHPTVVRVTSLYGGEFTAVTGGRFQVPFEILLMIYGFIIYLTLFRGILKEKGRSRKMYIAVFISILPINMGCLVFRLLYPVVGVYKVCSISTLAIPGWIVLYSVSKRVGFSKLEFAEREIEEVEPGATYIIEDPNRLRSLRLFKKLLNQGLEGLCISKRMPEASVRRCGTNNVVWISTLGVERSIPLTHLARIKDIVESFLKAGGRVVMIDNVESLILFNGFEQTIKFLNGLADIALKYKSVVLVPIDPRTVAGRELALLKKFLKEL